MGKFNVIVQLKKKVFKCGQLLCVGTNTNNKCLGKKIWLINALNLSFGVKKVKKRFYFFLNKFKPLIAVTFIFIFIFVKLAIYVILSNVIYIS